MESKKEWKVEGPCYEHAKDCTYVDLHEFGETTIYISPEVYSVINKLCKDIKKEWQMLLTGTQDNNDIAVTGYWIPKQRVGETFVFNLDIITPEIVAEKGIIGGIHSHGTMAVHFSPTDDEKTNNTCIKHHIVCNNRGEFEAKSRFDLPCGLYKFQKANVLICLPQQEIIGLDNIIIEEPAVRKWFQEDTGCNCNFWEVGVLKCGCTCQACSFGRHTDWNKKQPKHAILRQDMPKGPGGSLL